MAKNKKSSSRPAEDPDAPLPPVDNPNLYDPRGGRPAPPGIKQGRTPTDQSGPAFATGEAKGVAPKDPAVYPNPAIGQPKGSRKWQESAVRALRRSHKNAADNAYVNRQPMPATAPWEEGKLPLSQPLGTILNPDGTPAADQTPPAPVEAPAPVAENKPQRVSLAKPKKRTTPKTGAARRKEEEMAKKAAALEGGAPVGELTEDSLARQGETSARSAQMMVNRHSTGSPGVDYEDQIPDDNVLAPRVTQTMADLAMFGHGSPMTAVPPRATDPHIGKLYRGLPTDPAKKAEALAKLNEGEIRPKNDRAGTKVPGRTSIKRVPNIIREASVNSGELSPAVPDWNSLTVEQKTGDQEVPSIRTSGKPVLSNPQLTRSPEERKEDLEVRRMLRRDAAGLPMSDEDIDAESAALRSSMSPETVQVANESNATSRSLLRDATDARPKVKEATWEVPRPDPSMKFRGEEGADTDAPWMHDLLPVPEGMNRVWHGMSDKEKAEHYRLNPPAERPVAQRVQNLNVGQMTEAEKKRYITGYAPPAPVAVRPPSTTDSPRIDPGAAGKTELEIFDAGQKIALESFIGRQMSKNEAAPIIRPVPDQPNIITGGVLPSDIPPQEGTEAYTRRQEWQKNIGSKLSRNAALLRGMGLTQTVPDTRKGPGATMEESIPEHVLTSPEFQRTRGNEIAKAQKAARVAEGVGALAAFGGMGGAVAPLPKEVNKKVAKNLPTDSKSLVEIPQTSDKPAGRLGQDAKITFKSDPEQLAVAQSVGKTGRSPLEYKGESGGLGSDVLRRQFQPGAMASIAEASARQQFTRDAVARARANGVNVGGYGAEVLALRSMGEAVAGTNLFRGEHKNAPKPPPTPRGSYSATAPVTAPRPTLGEVADARNTVQMFGAREEAVNNWHAPLVEPVPLTQESDRPTRQVRRYKQVTANGKPKFVAETKRTVVKDEAGNKVVENGKTKYRNTPVYDTKPDPTWVSQQSQLDTARGILQRHEEAGEPPTQSPGRFAAVGQYGPTANTRKRVMDSTSRGATLPSSLSVAEAPIAGRNARFSQGTNR